VEAISGLGKFCFPWHDCYHGVACTLWSGLRSTSQKHRVPHLDAWTFYREGIEDLPVVHEDEEDNVSMVPPAAVARSGIGKT
jgi:hypothetical protein